MLVGVQVVFDTIVRNHCGQRVLFTTTEQKAMRPVQVYLLHGGPGRHANSIVNENETEVKIWNTCLAIYIG